MTSPGQNPTNPLRRIAYGTEGELKFRLADAIAAPPCSAVRMDQSGQRNRIAGACSTHGYHSTPNSRDAERRRWLARLRGLVAAAGSGSRRALARRACEAFDLRNALGCLPEANCAVALWALERRGGLRFPGLGAREAAARRGVLGPRCGAAGERRTAVGVDGVGRARTSARRRGPCGKVVAVSDLQRSRGVGRGALRRGLAASGGARGLDRLGRGGAVAELGSRGANDTVPDPADGGSRESGLASAGPAPSELRRRLFWRAAGVVRRWWRPSWIHRFLAEPVCGWRTGRGWGRPRGVGATGVRRTSASIRWRRIGGRAWAAWSRARGRWSWAWACTASGMGEG